MSKHLRLSVLLKQEAFSQRRRVEEESKSKSWRNLHTSPPFCGPASGPPVSVCGRRRVKIWPNLRDIFLAWNSFQAVWGKSREGAKLSCGTCPIPQERPTGFPAFPARRWPGSRPIGRSVTPDAAPNSNWSCNWRGTRPLGLSGGQWAAPASRVASTGGAGPSAGAPLGLGAAASETAQSWRGG